MYNSDLAPKRAWAKTEGSADALSSSSVHLTPLRKSEKGTAARTSPLRSSPATARSPLPPVWGTVSTSDFEESSDGAAPHRTTVMDPLAALRQCLQYVCSHPEVYGDDVRGLLDREVMHVVRLKASEVALTQGQRPLLVDPLDSLSLRQSARTFTSPTALPSISSANTAAPPHSHATSATTNTTTTGAAGNEEWAAVGNLFGYGGVSFLPASSTGFVALLRETRTRAMANRLKALSGNEDREATSSVSLVAAAAPQQQQQQPQQQQQQQLLDEPIQWNGTLPPSSLSGGGATNARTLAREAGGNAAASLPDYFLSGPYTDQQSDEDARLFRQVDEAGTSLLLPASRSALCAADGSALVLDHHGYEVTYLRTQLQQLEAAFNAKCVRLHELESENKLFAEQMKASEEAAARWSAEHHVMEGKLEALRRELDGWKDRANDALAAATKQSKQRSQHAKQLASNQISDAKQEAARLSQLWRETERALQESRRAFENTEKEATAAHNHLADAFHYLERLERRVARRDAYVQLCERRHRSLEEKYEKLMWGYEELSVVEGRYSYVDYLLTSRPLWSVYLFVSLAQHRGDYAALEDQGELQRRTSLMAAPFSEGNVPADGADGASSEVVDLQGWLLFARTPRGGCYAGSCYDPTLVLRLMVSEATAESMRRGRAKQLRTTLHGSVACRVIRWAERFAIDYLGGQDSVPDSGELNRKFVPVLTLASLLLPLRARSGAFAQAEAFSAAATTAAAASTTAAKPATTNAVGGTATPSLIAPIANARRYDVATLRFVLRCFWKERLHAFTAQMTSRMDAAQARRQRIERREAQRRASSNSVSTVQSGDIAIADPPAHLDATQRLTPEREEEEEEEEEEVEGGAAVATFLSALVDFAVRFTKLSGGGGATSGTPPGVAGAEGTAAASTSAPPDRSTLLRVRGVLARGTSAKTGTAIKSTGFPSSSSASSSDASLWDCGRVFFATVLQPATSSGTAVPKAATAPAATTAEASKSMLSESAGDVEVAALAEEVRELLAALYYYAMEYRAQDPDFRLFYLVSHQLIPEMVAVNFFASLESIQRDCAALLERRLRVVAEGGKGGESVEELTSALGNADDVSAVDDPLTALTRVVQLVDEAPLDGQDDEIEPDSDGEGYGSIIPFHAKAGLAGGGGGNDGTPVTSLPQPVAEGEAGERSRRSSVALSRKQSSYVSKAAQRRNKELQLLHNIRSYLKDRRVSLQDGGDDSNANGGGSSQMEEPEIGGLGEATRLSVFAFGDAPAEWTALEEVVQHRLAPHTDLLDAFRGRRGPSARDLTTASFASAASRSATVALSGIPTSASAAGGAARADRGYLRRKRDNRHARHEMTKCLSATRGLVTTDDVLSLLTRHCFATYAVSCCGTPRFSLTDALMKRSSVSAGGRSFVPVTSASLQPFAVVGHLPPTGLHLQRLRFALSLDRPCSLVNAADLFTVDAVTKSNTHLYNTYLSLTLDLFQQQQSFLMQSVLSSCAERHEKYAAEGAEDCDGHIPIASLRKGMTAAMTSIQGGAQHATALVNHFVQYDELLRLEDEVKLEQFADAPLLLNIPAPTPRPPTGFGAFRSAGNLKAAASFKGSFKGGYRSVEGATSFARRQSEANNNSVMEEVEDAEFNLHEEAESCSLLHIAFAVRMSYIVWGRLSVDTASALVSRIVQRGVPTGRSHPDDAAVTAPARGSAAATTQSSPAFGTQGAPTGRDGIRVVEQPEWEMFEQHVHQQYTRALARLLEGHNADDNPLRRTLRDGYITALGRSSVVPYSSAEAAARAVARLAAGEAAPSNTTNAATSAAGAGDADQQAVYPDLRNVFGVDDTARATSASPKPETSSSRRVSGVEKKKKTSELLSAPPQLAPPLTKSTSTEPYPTTAAAAAPMPDYGLLSLSRALGFVSPVTAAPSSSGNGSGLAAASKKGAGAKKAPKKTAGKKAAGAEAGNISTAAQEEYSRALSSQLQGLAARMARLLQPPPPPSGEESEKEAGEQSDAGVSESLARPQTSEGESAQVLADATTAAAAEPVCGVTFPDAENGDAAVPQRSTARTRSVAFVQDARGAGRAMNDARRSFGAGGEASARPGAASNNGGRSSTWRPVFAEEAREAEETADAASAAGSILDVSRLYTACAALSIL